MASHGEAEAEVEMTKLCEAQGGQAQLRSKGFPTCSAKKVYTPMFGTGLCSNNQIFLLKHLYRETLRFF